jgi:ribonuclease T2
MRVEWALALSTLLAAPLPALAQAYQCAPPSGPVTVPAITPDGPPHRAPIGGYVLAASWSPEYCRGSANQGSMQCSGRAGRFGFVLHGLWPDARSGAQPQWCAPNPRPSPELVRRNLCMIPVPWLIAHEWAKHGSCMARRPEDYYATSARLWRGLAWPDADRLARKQDLTAGDLRDAFIAANAGWQRRQIGLLVSSTGWLREIHLCMSTSFRPAACDAQTYGSANGSPLKIWRGL